MQEFRAKSSSNLISHQSITLLLLKWFLCRFYFTCLFIFLGNSDKKLKLICLWAFVFICFTFSIHFHALHRSLSTRLSICLCNSLSFIPNSDNFSITAHASSKKIVFYILSTSLQFFVFNFVFILYYIYICFLFFLCCFFFFHFINRVNHL